MMTGQQAFLNVPELILIDSFKLLTAGSAKKEMAKTLKHEATIFPIQVFGTVSP